MGVEKLDDDLELMAHWGFNEIVDRDEASGGGLGTETGTAAVVESDLSLVTLEGCALFLLNLFLRFLLV